MSGGTRILASAAGRPAEHLVTFHGTLATALRYASPNAAARVNVSFARDFDRYRTALHLHGGSQYHYLMCCERAKKRRGEVGPHQDFGWRLIPVKGDLHSPTRHPTGCRRAPGPVRSSPARAQD